MGIRYIDDDWCIIRGRKVKVSPIRYDKNGKKAGLEPSYGFMTRVKTPWGAFERCNVTAVPSLAGGLDYYAQVLRPKSNPGVHYCTFRVDVGEDKR